MEATELWKPFPADTRYEVSTHGRLRRTDSQRVRKCSVGAGGYLRVVLSYPGKTIKGYDLHFMVASTWLGPRPPGFEISHVDGNKLNNKISNLVYESRSANMCRVKFPERKGKRNLKLTAKDVKDIRASNESVASLATKYGVWRSSIWKIKTRQAWKHI